MFCVSYCFFFYFSVLVKCYQSTVYPNFLSFSVNCNKNVIYSDAALIQSISENSTFNGNDGGHITCNAIGNPIPVLTFSYDNRLLISSSKLNLSNQFLSFESHRLHNNTDLIEVPVDEDQDDINGVIRYKFPHTIEIELHLNEWPTGVHRLECTAFNTYGKDVRSTFIEHVLKPTFPHENDKLIDVVDGFPVDLNCDDVNGYPLPEITWQKVCKFLNIISI